MTGTLRQARGRRRIEVLAALVFGSFGLALPTLARAAPTGADAPPAATEPPSPDVAPEPTDSAPTAPAHAGSEPPATGQPATATSPTPSAGDIGATVVDEVLPSGVRIVAAEDRTLPVAAVVLAIELGTEDDPAAQPGLIHALAYHLWQGNRELAPAAAAHIVHASGGITEFAVGPAQVRYESLVPVSALDVAIWIEAQRLRAPTVNAPLWQQTLRNARRDTARKWSAPREALAAAHGVANLAREGDAAPAALDDLPLEQVSKALAEHFSYARATLVVVGPLPPQELAARARAGFADLPAHSRTAPQRVPAPATTQISVASPGKGVPFVWGVHGEPNAQLWARVWCRALEQQKRVAPEPNLARVRCFFDSDPRRPTMTVRVYGHPDARTFLASRLQRLQTTDAPLLERSAATIAEQVAWSLRLPLVLARALATASRTEAASGVLGQSGVASLRSGTPVWSPQIERAVMLIAAQSATPPETTPSQQPASQQAAPVQGDPES